VWQNKNHQKENDQEKALAVWDTIHQQASDNIKTAIIKEVFLAYQTFLSLLIYTDASKCNWIIGQSCSSAGNYPKCKENAVRPKLNSWPCLYVGAIALSLISLLGINIASAIRCCNYRSW
jgi:hypothetical protein